MRGAQIRAWLPDVFGDQKPHVMLELELRGGTIDTPQVEAKALLTEPDAAMVYQVYLELGPLLEITWSGWTPTTKAQKLDPLLAVGISGVKLLAKRAAKQRPAPTPIPALDLGKENPPDA